MSILHKILIWKHEINQVSFAADVYKGNMYQKSRKVSQRSIICVRKKAGHVSRLEVQVDNKKMRLTTTLSITLQVKCQLIPVPLTELVDVNPVFMD